MGMEFRSKGPIMGQTVLYTNSSGVVCPMIITSIVAGSGLVNGTTIVDQAATGNATNVPYDGTGVVQPSWKWSDDL